MHLDQYKMYLKIILSKEDVTAELFSSSVVSLFLNKILFQAGGLVSPGEGSHYVKEEDTFVYGSQYEADSHRQYNWRK